MDRRRGTSQGYTAEQIVGVPFSIFYTQEDQDAGVPARELAKASKTGRAEREGWRVRNDGTRFWGDEIITAVRGEEGVLSGFIKISRDLTERRLNEEALREGEARFRAAMEIETVGVIFFDLAGRVTEANDAFLRMSGYTRADVDSGTCDGKISRRANGYRRRIKSSRGWQTIPAHCHTKWNSCAKTVRVGGDWLRPN